jgi:hypothetical protein
MKLLLYLLICILIVGLFFFSKLTPYQNRLTGKYLEVFNIFARIFNPIITFLKKIVKPAQVGNGIAVDMSQIILLLLLLIILKFVL